MARGTTDYPAYQEWLRQREAAARQGTAEVRRGETEAQWRARMGYGYMPNTAQGFQESQDWLNQYEQSLSPLRQLAQTGPQLGALAEAYKEQDYLYKPLESYSPMDYQQAQYNFADTYAQNAPEAYKAAQYDFATGYQPPKAYQAYQYQTPEIAGIKDVSGIADAEWAGQEAKAREQIAGQFADTRERMKQAAIQGAARPEQMAALEANLGVEQAKAEQAALRDLGFERAKMNVGLATTAQGLEATRASQQATLEAQNQERMAQEMATKYGLDVDAARYIVSQQAAQQEAQAKENQAKYGLDATAAKELAAQQAAQQAATAGEQRYGQEWGKSERALAMGEEQRQREAQAAEYQKAQESAYGRSQDVNQQRMADWQARQDAYTQYANAQLQGQQAASQQAAQQATYETNLTEGERNARIGQSGEYTRGALASGQKPQTSKPTANPVTQPIAYRPSNTQTKGATNA